MPQKKEIIAGYIRESDPTLANSTTIESQAKAVREYAKKEGYLYDTSHHEYKEAISAYTVPYMEREKLQEMLRAAERGEFHVLVVSEVRAISRRQVEVFIIYDLLQKYGVRIETIKEKFEDDAMGRVILGLRAGFAEIEREQSYWRMQRGRRDRIEIGKAPNGHSKPAYGYILVDTDKEVHGRYEYNLAPSVVINGQQWSIHDVTNYFFTLLKQGESLHTIAYRFNDLRIPPPHEPRKGTPQWTPATLLKLARNPIYKGEVWANRYKRTGKSVTLRPQEEWIRLPNAPAYITSSEYDAIQAQLKINKDEALRNNKHRDNLGLLRGGYIFCGICGCRMTIHYPPDGSPRYICNKKSGSNKANVILNHNTVIRQPSLDRKAIDKIIETVKNPDLVRAKVEEKYREIQKLKQPITKESVNEAIVNLQVEMDNLFELARYATNDSTRERLGLLMQDLEKQQREANALLIEMDKQKEQRQALEAEIIRFEEWAARVREDLEDPNYKPTYDDLRLAVRVLGLRCTVYPTQGNWPFRSDIVVTVPKIMEKIYCIANKPKCALQPSVHSKSSTSVQCR